MTGSTVRRPNPATGDGDNQLGQPAITEVPVVVPSPAGAVSGLHFPTDLAHIIAVWHRLSQAMRAGILAMVQAAGGSDA